MRCAGEYPIANGTISAGLLSWLSSTPLILTPPRSGFVQRTGVQLRAPERAAGERQARLLQHLVGPAVAGFTASRTCQIRGFSTLQRRPVLQFWQSDIVDRD